MPQTAMKNEKKAGGDSLKQGDRVKVIIRSTGQDGGAAEASHKAAEHIIKFKSSRFGQLEVSEDKLISFPYGILGFPDLRRFILMDYEGDVPFKWLQCVDDPDVAFITVNPLLIKPDYKIIISEHSVSDLGHCQEDDMAVLVILTLPDSNPNAMTANLRGPLVINSATRKGKQIVLEESAYQVKHPVFG